MGFLSQQTLAMHTPIWRGSILINVVRGSKVSQARPLSQVHKNGHAILCALTFASSFCILTDELIKLYVSQFKNYSYEEKGFSLVHAGLCIG